MDVSQLRGVMKEMGEDTIFKCEKVRLISQLEKLWF